MDHLTVLRLPTQPDRFKDIDPKIKAGLTRAINKRAGPKKCVTVAGKKKGGQDFTVRRYTVSPGVQCSGPVR